MKRVVLGLCLLVTGAVLGGGSLSKMGESCVVPDLMAEIAAARLIRRTNIYNERLAREFLLGQASLDELSQAQLNFAMVCNLDEPSA